MKGTSHDILVHSLFSLGVPWVSGLQLVPDIGVRDGGAGGSFAPPIRAVCRHEFGQRVEIIRAKHNTCLNNTNLVSVTGVNGEKHELRVCYCS